MSQAHFGALPQYGNIMVKTGQLESTNRPSKVKPMRTLQDSIFHKHTLFFWAIGMTSCHSEQSP